MDYDSLKLFLHLADTLHFGKTSRSCFISPSGLSRAIQRLEKEIGEEIFIRDNRSVSLTSFGALFKEYAKDTLDRWQKFKDIAFDTNKELRGEINLYCSVTASYSILQNILKNFRKLHPNVLIKLQTGEAAKAIQMVQNKDAQIAIAARPDHLPKDIDFKIVEKTPLIFIGPKEKCSVTEKLEKDMNNWWDLPLILPEHGLARKRIQQLFKSNNKVPNIYAEVSGNEAIIAMVSLGCGIGIAPELVLSQSSLQIKIQKLNFNFKLKPYIIGFCINNRGHNSFAVQAFWNLIE